MKYKKTAAIIVSIFNLLLIALGIHVVKGYYRWEAMQLSPEIRLKYGEEILRVVSTQVLPACIITMALSAVMLWLLRKS